MMTSPSATVRRRAKVWSDWARIAQKGNTEGVKSQAEIAGGIKTDVALQFAKGEKRAPRASEYQAELRRFLARYGNVVNNLSPWNEPQLKLSFRTSRSLFLPPSLGVVGGLQ